ncbi:MULTISPECIES: hypothetical protein [Olivibacter]|uniref:Uncharacterized protein n=1 Tax=Olivibacter jilunii TaxID=985016 RepID=A0ABW6B5V4_9SPHI
MKRNTQKKTIRKADLYKDLKPIIKPVRNTRTKIRQLLRSFIPLHSSVYPTPFIRRQHRKSPAILQISQSKSG